MFFANSLSDIMNDISKNRPITANHGVLSDFANTVAAPIKEPTADVDQTVVSLCNNSISSFSLFNIQLHGLVLIAYNETCHNSESVCANEYTNSMLKFI